MELLKLSIANPKFVNPDLTRDYKEYFKENDLLAYQQYAFAAWNIVETIVDRRKVEDLGATWDPVIKEENRLHRAWLNDPDNEHKFKNHFWKFVITNNQSLPCPNCAKGGGCTDCNRIRMLANSGPATQLISD